MIAGEEHILPLTGNHHDAFFKKWRAKRKARRKALSPEQKAGRKEKRRKFWDKLSEAQKKLKALSTAHTDPPKAPLAEASDYGFGLAGPGKDTPSGKSNTGLYILGGIFLVGAGVVVAMKYKPKRPA